MTIKDWNPETEEVTEILNIFYQFGVTELRSFTNKIVDEHKLSPHEYYLMMVSLLEAFMKYFTVNCDRTSLKEIFDLENRQEVVNVFSNGFSEGAIKFEDIIET